ncbi:glycoside hydrolase family 5 protein [Tilletiaria anomala UBC 951]|uniref:glucan 1,3-beta-glucosidase n=1 Tax=Tilletiaria anomala (strain ATCC 24038 / CBS 436.72 / UBC 951) TaxID=1037660 RepID=A0A066VT93_TILAU|nr:glycoside hydrolase family 5 protein [Tilletiaria anomala UBC 951]KDN44691.1 glycoside hydrolase family 5 protein [Tilletiaria anomala UBC 951]
MDPSIRDSYIHVGRDTVLQSSPLNNKQLPLSSSYYAEADRAPGVARYAGLGDAHRRQEDHRVHYSQRKKAVIVGIVALIVAAVCVAVVVPVTEHFLNKPDTSSEPGGIVDKDGNVVATTGGNGSVIILEDGTKYTYINPFGGTWNSGLLNNSAQAQWYTPPLSEEFHFGGKQGNRRRQGSRASGSSENGSSGRIIGVNVGGWLVTEPFIVPALYEPYANGPNAAVDEFTLSQQWLKEGGLARLKQKLTQHYDTFITERDFADIACAGLNWVRLPIGFWALETIDDEPFLEGVSWQYFLKAIQWARKYGLRINLDLHAVPGSANSFNHGGKLGPTPPSTVGINFLQGPAGLVNAQRALNYIRIITEFISQPEIAPVVPMFTVINEPYLPTAIGVPALSAWYAELYSEIRNNITGLGKGHGPFIGMHDGFLGLRQWENYMPGADRIGWDVHPYIAFGPKYTDDFSKIVPGFCNAYGPQIDRALANNGLSFAGEWSPAVNDCGLYLNGVGLGTRYENTYQGNGNVYGNCTKWTDWTKWDETMKSSIRQFAEVSMDSLKNTFFWSWKIGNSSQSGRVEAPTWSYQLGLQQGWLPTDPYHAGSNACSSAASSYSASIAATTSWSSTFEGWKTGDTAAPYTANPSAYPWPPSSISGAGVAVTNMPSYTRTGSISKAPPPAWTESQSRKPNPTISNWAQKSDNAPMYVKVKGCSYQLDQYSVSGIPGSWPCSGSAMSKRKTTSIPTPTTT